MSEDVFEFIDDQSLLKITSYLERGGDPNQIDGDGAPLLHHAVIGAHLKVIELLAKHGADVNYEIPEDQFASDCLAPTCISLALQCRYLTDKVKYSPVVDLLFKLGAKDET